MYIFKATKLWLQEYAKLLLMTYRASFKVYHYISNIKTAI